ncbi:hypothetical protein MTR_6g052320 [Medicago truncatula]|uniref:Uncharacterized protein n=1 Tax=Medicago truncatula TaxID=3880 RepID=G7KLG2_MEDTR|nr:hypothetical protein MTR_6g052320 [Medicago truncatula]
MHVVPTRASSPQHNSINTLTGRQALNVRAKAHRASSPQLNEYAWTQQRVQLGQHQQLI